MKYVHECGRPTGRVESVTCLAGFRKRLQSNSRKLLTWHVIDSAILRFGKGFCLMGLDAPPDVQIHIHLSGAELLI